MNPNIAATTSAEAQLDAAPGLQGLKPELGGRYYFNAPKELRVFGDEDCKANDVSVDTFPRGKSFTLLGISLPKDYSERNTQQVYKLAPATYIKVTPGQFAAMVDSEKRVKDGGKREFGKSPKFRVNDGIKYKIHMLLDEMEVSKEVREKAASMAHTLCDTPSKPEKVSFSDLRVGDEFRVRQEFINKGDTSPCNVRFAAGTPLTLINAQCTKDLTGDKEDISLTLKGSGMAINERGFDIATVVREFTVELNGCELLNIIGPSRRCAEGNFEALIPKRAASFIAGPTRFREGDSDANLIARLKAAVSVVEAADYTMPSNTTNRGARWNR